MPVISLPLSKEKLLNHFILKQSFLKDYPKSGVIFLAIDPVLQDPEARNILSNAVSTAVQPLAFDCVAGIASRGYIFSSLIAEQALNQSNPKGEQLIQKVKVKGDPRFVQMGTSTEYSSDDLQIMKGTIQHNKNYLLADDLIATGGSVMTAIQLIRDSGGTVDKVFVMTELLDFGAREKLKKLGVELVSLFQFTQQDMKELLILQETCQTKPIEYQLSHHRGKVMPPLSAQDTESRLDAHKEIKEDKSTNIATVSRMIQLKKMKHSAINQAIDLYNHGYSLQWNIDEKVKKQNDFKVFSTGDAFSILSPHVDVKGMPVNIHVGIDQQQKYSPWTLLQEALQMCRTVREQGAESITVALPDQYHPELHKNQFNELLKDLFESQGVDRLYFYDKSYQGKMEATEVLSIEKKPSMHIILCCSTNKPFAEELAKSLKARGENVKLCVIQTGDTQALIPSDVDLSDATVTLVQSTRPNPDDEKTSMAYETNGASSYFFETMMVARQARLRGAKQINLVNTYQFGARSDKSEDNHIGKVGAYVQQNGSLLETAGVNHVVTAECHDQHTLSGSYMRKNITSSAVPALTLLSTIVAKQWLQSPHEGKFRLVEPDAGAAKRTKELAQFLQPILGNQLHESRVVGDKKRGSHQDDSAHINQLNSGSSGFNVKDKYLITDDETATGTTLCQTIQSLKNEGAQDISVIVVHNNMPLDWLARQLCIARFLFMGVNDLHFSNTQEMGTLAKDYEDLVQTHVRRTSKTRQEVETEIGNWFKKNLPNSSLSEFKTIFSQFAQRVIVHNLADAFADKLVHQPKPSMFAKNTLFSAPAQIANHQASKSVAPEHKHAMAGC